MDEVMEYLVKVHGFTELGKEELEEEYNEMRASFLIQHASELLGEYAELPKLKSESQEDLLEYMRQAQERVQRCGAGIVPEVSLGGTMTTREEVLAYGLSLANTYQDAPFHDENWQLVRVKKNKKVFLWTYERNGTLCINVKVSPEWREFWRNAYPSVQPGYHQNKEHWNTVILDGTVPEKEIKRMIAESYDLVAPKRK